MKVYISGPITGTDDQMDRFQAAEEQLRREGYIPYNPAAINAMMPAEADYEEYMAVSMTILDKCEAIYQLQGWEKSPGANREYGYALGTDKIIIKEIK